MSSFSPFILMTLQDLDENPDIWGSILNTSALELLEDAIAGTANVGVTGGNVTLETDPGQDNNPHYRMMILNVTGSPGQARDVIAPATSQVYLCANNVDAGHDITLKVAGQTGVTIPNGSAYWCYSNGTDIVAAGVELAGNATLATTATNATQLGGIAAAGYGPLATANTWTQGQVTERETVTSSLGNLQINCADTNAFFIRTTESFNLQAPTNATNGQIFTLVVQQGVGGNHTISFQSSTFLFAGGIAPTLSTAEDEVDYLAFEYVTGLTTLGSRWIGSIIKGVA